MSGETVAFAVEGHGHGAALMVDWISCIGMEKKRRM